MNTARKLLLIIMLLLGYLLLPKSASASNLHLAPSSGNIGLGQTLAVQVKLNTAGQPINGVTAILSYPADKLDVAFITPGSDFSIEAEKTVGGGNIRISRGNISGVVGDAVVATIGFRGKTLGSASVNFISGSAAPNATTSTDTLSLGGSRGGSFTIVPATATPSPVISGTKITNIKVTNISSSSATISWKTDRKSSSEIDYGVDKKQFVLSSIKADLVTDHIITLNNLQFPPGTKIYFQVKSKDEANLESTSDVNTIQLKGYRVIVKISDKGGKPLSNIKTTLYSEPMESATNDQGQVVYEDVMPGKHVVLIQNGSLEDSKDIQVADNGKLDQTQEYQIQFDPTTSTTTRSAFNLNSKNTLALVILGISFLILIVISIYIFTKKQGGGGSNSSGGDSSFPFFNSSASTKQTPVVVHSGSSGS